jgi:hypothetical protein
MNQPFFDSVPLPSVVVFAALWPMSLAFCVQLFVGRHVDYGTNFTRPQVLWRTIVVGVLASLGTALLPMPATVLGKLTDSTTVSGVVYALELAALSAVAIPVLVGQWRALRQTGANHTNPLILGYAAVYLAVMAALWVTALPSYFSATGGLTSDGDPVGSLWYAVLCFAIAACAIAACHSVGRPRHSHNSLEVEAVTP